MSSPTPPPPNEVPETDATYERTNMENALDRKDAIDNGVAKGTQGGGGKVPPTGPLDDAQSKASTPMQSSREGSRDKGGQS